MLGPRYHGFGSSCAPSAIPDRSCGRGEPERSTHEPMTARQSETVHLETGGKWARQAE